MYYVAYSSECETVPNTLVFGQNKKNNFLDCLQKILQIKSKYRPL